jgi:plastocyanin
MINEEIKRVHIRVEAETQEINYSAALLRAKPGDTIQWWSNDGPFAIQFAGISPVSFGGGRSLGRKDKFELEGTVRQGALPGAYRYACALAVDGKVHLDAGCPEIIIDTEGNG